jgi:hypothetical protein
MLPQKLSPPSMSSSATVVALTAALTASAVDRNPIGLGARVSQADHAAANRRGCSANDRHGEEPSDLVANRYPASRTQSGPSCRAAIVLIVAPVALRRRGQCAPDRIAARVAAACAERRCLRRTGGTPEGAWTDRRANGRANAAPHPASAHQQRARQRPRGNREHTAAPRMPDQPGARADRLFRCSRPKTIAVVRPRRYEAAVTFTRSKR